MDQFLDYMKYVNFVKDNIDVYENVHVVLGNESCDLDSTVSALALAYLLDKTGGKSNTVHVPLMHISYNDFLVRTENCYCLKKVGISLDFLIFWDNIDLTQIKNLTVSLVDHHVLKAEEEYLKNYVVEIFDHRPIDTNASWDATKIKIVIEQVGSCSTLITNEIFKNEDILSKSLAWLLYETIVFDTIGFKPEAGKATALDFEMADKLEQYLDFQGTRIKIFDGLWEAHNDVSQLTPKQLLSKDLKVVSSVCIPGLPMMVEKYLQIESVFEAMNEFIEERECTVLVLMGLEAKDVVTRDLAFYSTKKNCVLLGKLVENLTNMEILALNEIDLGYPQIKYFEQRNSQPSRKQILPVIKETVKNFD